MGRIRSSVLLGLAGRIVSVAVLVLAVSGHRAAALDLTGAGATFPYPLYSKWIAQYGRLHPDVRINYQSIGSGGGIKQITERTVEFGASDAPMTDGELAKVWAKLFHVPMALGAVVVAFNLPGVDQLTLTPDLLSAIFLGDIVKWNDPRLKSANSKAALPAADIAISYRSDGSGTTAVFTDYLSRVSPAWKRAVGAGKSVRFPVGIGAKGNEGVSGQLKSMPGSIGYVELAYAKQSKLSTASIVNRDGRAIAPTLESISASAAEASLPDDLRMSITDPPGKGAYPISSFTYILVYEEQADAAKAQALLKFLDWALTDGQRDGAALDYAPLPAKVVAAARAKLKAVKIGGKPIPQ